MYKGKYHGSTGNLTVVLILPMLQIPYKREQNTSGKDHHIQGIHVDAAEKTVNCQNGAKTVRKKTVRSGYREKQADKDRHR